MLGERYRSVGLAPRTKTVQLVFRRDELLYDIKNSAYVEGEVMTPKKEDQRDKVLTQDIGEPGNVDRVVRMLDMAHAECTEALFPYTKEVVGMETEEDNHPSSDSCECTIDSASHTADESDYVINMLVPDGFSKTTVDLLVKYIHEYMVCRALGDWFSTTDREAATLWLGKQEDALTGIQRCVNMRVKRTRRTQTPF